MIFWKKPAPLGDHLQEAGPSRWSFATKKRAWQIHFWDPSLWDEMCFEYERIKCQWKNGSNFTFADGQGWGGSPPIPRNFFGGFPKLSKNIRVLFSMTYTSKKYERTQQGNQLASSSEVVAAKVSLFLRRFLWCLVIQASEVSLSNGQVEKKSGYIAAFTFACKIVRSPVKIRSIDMQRHMFDHHQCNVHTYISYIGKLFCPPRDIIIT